MTDRREILDTAASLIGGERQQDYGSAADNFARIGNLWAEVLGVPVSPVQVALCMGLVKVARLINSPDHLDSWVDGAGYLALGGEIATELPEVNLTSVIYHAAPADHGEPRFEPRVVEYLTPHLKDAKWMSKGGLEYSWHASSHSWERRDALNWGGPSYGNIGHSSEGPYTEVIK